MSQIQVRDQHGNAAVGINVRIAEGQQSSEKAIYDIFTDFAGNSGWPIPFWPKDREFTLWVNYENIDQRYEKASRVLPVGHGDNVEIMLELIETLVPSPGPGPEPGPGPRGIVRASGRMLLDDNGPKNFLTTTLMWSVWGAQFDNKRWRDNLYYCQSFGLDGIRTLGSVMGDSWEGRKIDPSLPGYEAALADQIDTAFQYGLRQFPLTMLGDHFTNIHAATDKMINVMRGREEKIGYVEIANEWGHAVVISKDDLLRIAMKVRAAFPNMLLALSRPQSGSAGTVEMKDMLRQIGGPQMFPRHGERNEGDRNWRQVRQMYDHQGDQQSGSNQEPAGQASSVGTLYKPRQRGMMHFLATGSGCGVDCLHTGNGVRGKDDPANNRQPDLMQVPGFADFVKACKQTDKWLPEGVQNWKVVNNGASRNHPLYLPGDVGDGFWEGNKDVVAGDVNKNYAFLHPNNRDFLVGFYGLNEGQARRSGQALYNLHITCYDSLLGQKVFDDNVKKGDLLKMPGRQDREISYVGVGYRL